MTRLKRLELVENVVIAARVYVAAIPTGRTHQACVDLIEAVEALDAHDPTPLTGRGARWNRNAPETSRLAAIRATPLQGSARYRIVKLLEGAQPGCTDETLERMLHRKHQTISSARNWLCEAGWVRDSGHRASTRSGRDAVVWELTPAAERAIIEGDL